MQTRQLNGATVRELREALGISQGDLAARIGITRPTLSNIERRVHGVRPVTCRKIADALGVPLDAITYPVPPGRLTPFELGYRDRGAAIAAGETSSPEALGRAAQVIAASEAKQAASGDKPGAAA